MIIEVTVICCSAVVLITYIIAKSKCSEVDWFGLHIKRDVQLEEKSHEFDVTHGVKELPKISDIM